MKTLVHGTKDGMAAELMVRIQKEEDFPLRVEVGKDAFTLGSKKEARMFALGMLAALEGVSDEDAAFLA
jgi:hypothetical protein